MSDLDFGVTPESAEREAEAYDRVLEQAVRDPQYRRRLVEDPVGILSTEGVRIEDGVDYRIHEADERTIHLILPPLGSEVISSAALRKILQPKRGGR